LNSITATMGSQLSLFFPPAPTFTEKELPDQAGKVSLPLVMPLFALRVK